MLVFCLMDGIRDEDKVQRSAKNHLSRLEIFDRLEISVSLDFLFWRGGWGTILKAHAPLLFFARYTRNSLLSRNCTAGFLEIVVFRGHINLWQIDFGQTVANPL